MDIQRYIEDNFHHFLCKYQAILNQRQVIVGFSGGADSTALLCLFHTFHYPTIAVHIHHGLRGPQADQDAQWCEHFCLSRGIPFILRKVNVKANQKKGESIEMAARRFRLTIWAEFQGSIIALAHHQDDVLETFLLRLCRGGNLSSLMGLRPYVKIRGIEIIRPLLQFSRQEIESYLTKIGISGWCEDETNQQTHFLRNRIRHHVLPVLTECAGGNRYGLYHTIENLWLDVDFIESHLPPHTFDTLSFSQLKCLHPTLRVRLLLKFFQYHQIPPEVINKSLIQKCEEIFQKFSQILHPIRINLSGNIFLLFHKDTLQIERQTVPSWFEKRWYWERDPICWVSECSLRLNVEWREIDGNSPKNFQSYASFPHYQEYFLPESLSSNLIIRSRQPGDRMIPWGEQTHRRLKKLIGESSLPSHYKATLCIICHSNGEILWVPGIRRSCYGGIPESYKGKVVILSAEFITNFPS